MRVIPCVALLLGCVAGCFASVHHEAQASPTPDSAEDVDHYQDLFLEESSDVLSLGPANGLGEEKGKGKPKPVIVTGGDTLTEYKFAVSTGGQPSAGTADQIYLTVHGKNGDTGEFALNDRALLTGQTQSVTRELADVGELTKIRIRNPSKDDWACDVIKIEKNRVVTEFKVHKIIMSPHQSTRWAYAEVEYILSVQTGADTQAGTASPVFITIYGSEGSTGEVKLADSFAESTMVSVSIRARNIGKPSYIQLHNPNEDDWHCESIRIVSAQGSFDFSTDKWVAFPRHPKASVPVDKVYSVFVTTGVGFDDGTQGEVFIQMIGEAGATGTHLLSNGFDRGTNVTAAISAKDVGTVTKIILTTPESNTDSWHCISLDIGETLSERVHFDVDGWMQAPIAMRLSTIADIPYTLVTKTSAEEKSSSTGQFAVNIYGSLGVTRVLPLMTNMGFMSNSTSRFTLYAKDVGEITKVRISTRNSDGWKCKDLVITKRGKAFPFSIDKWVQFPLAATVDTPVDVKYTFSVVTGKEKDADTKGMIFVVLFGTRGQTRPLPLKTGFALGSAETMSFKAGDIGRLTAVKINSKSDDNWFCESLQIHHGSETVPFEVKKWLVFPNMPSVTVERKFGQ